MDRSLAVVPDGGAQIFDKFLLIRRGDECLSHLATISPLIVIQELKSGKILNLQTYGRKPAKQATNPRLPPHLDLGVGLFRINVGEELADRFFGSVFLGVYAVVAEEHR